MTADDLAPSLTDDLAPSLTDDLAPSLTDDLAPSFSRSPWYGVSIEYHTLVPKFKHDTFNKHAFQMHMPLARLTKGSKVMQRI